jgi:hypothetical protein
MNANVQAIENPASFFDKVEAESDGKRTELKNYLIVIKGNLDRFEALTEIGCRKTDDSITPRDMVNYYIPIMTYILSGKMKVNGKKNNWSCGCFGSRWFDWDNGNPDKIICRIAFYSKKYSTNWKFGDKPYALTLDFAKKT